MFDRTSRYHDVEEATLQVTDPDGTTRDIPYAKRRFVPRVPDHPAAATHTVTEGERLDHIADRYLGDPTLFWHLLDGTDVLDPDEVTAEPGRVLDIRLPGLGL